MKHRFKVVEYVSGYTLLDTVSGKERWLSDGVDVLITPTGKTMKPGSEYFRKTWERSFNEDSEEEICEAYGFPHKD